MITDAQLAFVPIGAPLSLVNATPGAAIPSLQTIDLMGSGVGTPPPNIFGSNATVFGQDVGVNDTPPLINVTVGTAATTSTAATLNVQLQAAADQGAAGGYQPSTWNTLGESGVIAVGSLTINTVIARLPFLPSFPANLNPRYIRLLFQVGPSGSGLFTAGTISSALVVMTRDDQANKYAPSNFKVA